MDNLQEKLDAIWWRAQYLEVMRGVVTYIAFSGNLKDKEKMMEYVKYFGKESEKLKNKIKNL